MARRFILAALAAATLSACGGDDGGSKGPGLPDHRTGPVSPVPTVSSSKTVLEASADTHEVATDGNWIVWRGRQINLSYFDGAGVSTLDLGLPGAATPWAFEHDCRASPIAFDGATLAVVARNVSRHEPPALYVTRPGQAARKLALPFEGSDRLDDLVVHVSGAVAAVWDREASELRAVDHSAATPSWTENLMPPVGTPAMPIGRWWPVWAGGHLDLIDLSTGDTTSLTGDDNEGTGATQLHVSSGVLTWVEGTQAYFFDTAGAAGDSTAVAPAGPTKAYPIAGPDYLAWNENGDEIWVLFDGAPEPVLAGMARNLSTVEPGDGFLGFIGVDDTGAQQLFAYGLDDLGATEADQVSQNGARASDPNAGSSFQVDGTRMYAVFDYEQRHIPGKSLVTYDVATSTLRELVAPAQTQRIALVRAAGGKAIVLHADHSFRLFAKAAGSGGAPSIVSPATLNVHKFAVTSGLVSFTALDRAAWSPEMLQILRDEFGSGAAIEVYTLDLDGDRVIHRITQNVTEDETALNDGRWITWHDNENDLGFAYDTETKVTKLLGAAEHKLPVANGVAVWRDGNNIRKVDLATGAAEVLWTGTSIQKCPEIAGSVVTWNDNFVVHYRDLADADGEVVTVEGSHAAYAQNAGTYLNQGPVATDGRYLTWNDARQGWTPAGAAGPLDANVVVVHDTQTGLTVDLPAADWTQTGWDVSGEEDGNNGPVCHPRISNGVVAFNAIEYGEDNPDDDKEIFYAKLGNLATAAPVVVRLTTDAHDDAGTDADEGAPLWDSQADITNGLVVWRTGGGRYAAGYVGGEYSYWQGRSPAAARIP